MIGILLNLKVMEENKMSEKIIINYEISDEMEVSFSGTKELAKYCSLDEFKSVIGKYLLRIDNKLNVDGKILKAGTLEFVIEKNNLTKNDKP